MFSDREIDQRKDEYLQGYLFQFPLKPHWLIETRHGFHVIFRIQPQRGADDIYEAESLNCRLVRALHGDPNAALLTQLLRVPGTYHLKNPPRPFLCRLLIDNAPSITPYHLSTVRSALDAWEGTSPTIVTPTIQSPLWRGGLAGVPVGKRNATAASLAGRILAALPEELWETAGWGGLKEWNGRNRGPLTEEELRSVFESIARRERTSRLRNRRAGTGPNEPGLSSPGRDAEQ